MLKLHSHRIPERMPVKVESTPMLPGLSPVGGKTIEARFDGACMSSDGGLLALREVEQRLAIASRLAGCIRDPRDPSRVIHGLDEIIRTRMLMIAAGYEDGNDVDALRRDPMFKLAMGRLPDDGDLCSQPTISRLENLPDARALLRMGRAMVEHYCHSFRQVPRRVVLDIDDTFDAVHGGQQLRLFNAHHDEYGFQPIVVFDGDGRMIAAVLRPASRPSGKQIVRWLHRLITAIRGHWPLVEIMLRADSHYCTPKVLRFCRVRGLDYTLGVAPHLDAAQTRPQPRAEHRRPCCHGCGQHEAAPVQGILRRRGELGPRGAHCCSRGSRTAGHRHTLHRHQPHRPVRPNRLSGYLLRTRAGGEPHQGMEDAFGRRPDLVLPGKRQPVPPVPACRRLLAHVEPAHADAAPGALAGRSVRHPTAAG